MPAFQLAPVSLSQQFKQVELLTFEKPIMEKRKNKSRSCERLFLYSAYSSELHPYSHVS